jgi:hypothetical protein
MAAETATAVSKNKIGRASMRLRETSFHAGKNALDTSLFMHSSIQIVPTLGDQGKNSVAGIYNLKLKVSLDSVNFALNGKV